MAALEPALEGNSGFSMRAFSHLAPKVGASPHGQTLKGTSTGWPEFPPSPVEPVLVHTHCLQLLLLVLQVTQVRGSPFRHLRDSGEEDRPIPCPMVLLL